VTGTAAIAAEGLTVGYPGRAVVAGLDLQVARGQSLALVGVNGSGKSTLLKTLAGLLAPVEGSLRLFGGPPGRNAARIAYLSQFHPRSAILPLRVRDVVLTARYARRGLLRRMTSADHDTVTLALQRVGIGHLAQNPLWSLSGGQQQRVYLAQVLAAQADILLLDEPTSGLDVGAGQQYADLVNEELSRGATVVIATHDLREAARCDTAILLAGRVVASGPPAQVLAPQRLLDAFGVALIAIPHDGHTDIAVPQDPHGHERPSTPRPARG
jgi:ABC-type Mn2+/Zn2+ transport system ATPase subunit